MAARKKADAGAKHRAEERDGEHGEDSLAFLLSAATDVGTLGNEIAKAIGTDRVGLVTEGNPTRASADEPAVIWVFGEGVTPEVVSEVIEAHAPSGQSKIVRPGTPGLGTASQDALDRRDRLLTLADKSEGDDLSDEEVREAVVLMLQHNRKRDDR